MVFQDLVNDDTRLDDAEELARQAEDQESLAGLEGLS